MSFYKVPAMCRVKFALRHTYITSDIAVSTDVGPCRPSLGQDGKTKVFVTFKKKKKEWKYSFPVPSPNLNPTNNFG